MRKTRCDGAKPVCFNCRKRPPEDGEQCNYEQQPKRRGQDKVPGLRVRVPTSQRPAKRKRVSSDAGSEDDSDDDAQDEEASNSHQLHASYDSFPGLSSDVCISFGFY